MNRYDYVTPEELEPWRAKASPSRDHTRYFNHSSRERGPQREAVRVHAGLAGADVPWACQPGLT
jgi:hypothetical protein